MTVRLLQGPGPRLLPKPDFALGLNGKRRSGHLFGGVAEIHNACASHPKCRHALAMRLDFLELVGVNALELLDLVLLANPVNLLQHRKLGLVGGHNDLSTHVVRHVVFFAELHKLPPSLHAIGGLERTWLVVKPRVDHTRIVAGLVIREARHLVDEQHAPLRKALLELVKRGGPDDSAAHNHHIKLPV